MSRCWIGEYNESWEQEAWRGYEFWSAQVEAEMELIEEENASVHLNGLCVRPAAKASQEGASDVLPF